MTFRTKVARTKDEIPRISFALLLHNTVCFNHQPLLRKMIGLFRRQNIEPNQHNNIHFVLKISKIYFFPFATRETRCKQRNFMYDCMKIDTGLEKKSLRQPPIPCSKLLGLRLPSLTPPEFLIPSVGDMGIIWNYTIT